MIECETTVFNFIECDSDNNNNNVNILPAR